MSAFEEVLSDVGGIVADLIPPTMPSDALARLLGEIRPDPYLESVWHQADGYLKRIGHGGPWIPENLDEHASWLLSTHWDFLGPAEPSPMSGNPGSVHLYWWNQHLVFFEPAAAEWFWLEAPTANVSGGQLSDTLDGYYDFFVNRQTYSLRTPGWDHAEIGTFLESSGAVGVLQVDNAWWRQTPSGWTPEPPATNKTDRRGPLPRAGPTFDAKGLTIELSWLLGSHGPIDVLLFDTESLEDVPASAVLGGVKINGRRRSPVALAQVLEGSDRGWVGIAVAAPSEDFATWLGAVATITLDVESQTALLAGEDGSPFPCVVLAGQPRTDLWALPDAILGGDRLEILHLPAAPSIGADEPTESHPAESYSPASLDQVPLEQVQPPAARYVFRRDVGEDEDGVLWVDPLALTRPGGLPGNDVRLVWSDDGVLRADTQELGDAPVADRDPSRHTLRLPSVPGGTE